MSTPATDQPADSRQEILELPGQSALSDFRLDSLCRELASEIEAVTGISAGFTYFASLEEPLSRIDRDRLDALLLAGEPVQPFPRDATRIVVVPRPGTTSPWSSKATDIVRACHLDCVLRVERGITYAIESRQRLEMADVERLAPLLHDRMTEAWFAGAAAAGDLFRRYRAAPMATVPLLADGAGALVRADAELGLALSDDEIDYLVTGYRELGRDPTDVELMMFAQANSEHCRHKIFNAEWIIDGERRPERLFGMIRSTTEASAGGVISAYSDNAAVMEGWQGRRLMPATGSREFGYVEEPIHILMKVETHNHPTAISPFPGAATGAGGEIRDEGATGLGARPKAGLTGFTVSHLRIPGFEQPWEPARPHPARMATPLQIMLEGPIGAAAFNNEFGRPNLLGYFRSFEAAPTGARAGELHGYHKPIMLAGGLGNVRALHARKIDVPAGAALVVLGGPAMLIGLGGGAASSLASGSSSEDLDFASVQRGNPEMQRRAQEVIDRCWAMGEDNPILLIHDVGAGGLSNAVPEAVDHSRLGADVELRQVPNAEPGMSPMAIWCNEAQERYVLVVGSERVSEFAALCERERCPPAVIGTLNASGRLRVTDLKFDNVPVDLPMSLLLGKTPHTVRDVVRAPRAVQPLDLDGITPAEAAFRVLRFPAVADKSFLINIGDRTVGGLSVRDQFVGPWQVPVSDVAITASGFDGVTGEAMAIGERTPLATLDAPASGRMAVGEAITNIAAAAIGPLQNVKLSANWMAAAGHPGEDARLFDTVKAVGAELCRTLGVAIPVGKDSLSMRARWQDEDGDHQVSAPVSLVVSAFAPVSDVRRHLTPCLQAVDEPSRLLMLDIGEGADRLGGSSLAQVYDRSGGMPPDLDHPDRLASFFAAVQMLAARGVALAYHDRSDGGLFVTVAEMMFAGRLGASLQLPGSEQALLARLFAEELGGVVQVAQSRLAEAREILETCGASWIDIGAVEAGGELIVYNDDELVLRLSRVDMHRAWSETSWRMQSLRDNPHTAAQEYDRLLDCEDPGLNVSLSFDPGARRVAPAVGGRLPSVAILREQGVNSQYEMAAAFLRAGFRAVDVHMSDLCAGRDDLAGYQAIVACGGFSYGDVLGAGGGWARSILYQSALRDQFAAFFARADSLTLGVCNGCQMLSHLRELIPGSDGWPRFLRNESEQFEARLSLVEIVPSPSLILDGMSGSRLPIVTSHGEGRAVFAGGAPLPGTKVALRYVDNYGEVATTYPANPNGSTGGICGLTSDDGRATIVMPHPERVARTVQHSWHPDDWGDDGPWMHLFRNARAALA